MCDKMFSHYNVVVFNVWDRVIQVIKCDTEEDAIKTAINLFDCDVEDKIHKIGIEQVYNLVNWWRK